MKKALDRVWHAGLWQDLRSFNIAEGLVKAIKALFENSSSAVFSNNQLGEFFKTTVCVRQGCLLSPILFNLFLVKIMHETFNDHRTPIPTGERPISDLRFAVDVDLMGGSNGELQDLTIRLVDRATAHGMEVSPEKSRIMTNSTNNI